MNKIILTGNIVNDTVSREKLAKNSIAVRRDFKNEDGEYDTDFFEIIAFGHQADYMKNYICKGDKVEISGKMQIRQYQTQDGINRKAYEVIIESIGTLIKANQDNIKPQDEGFEEVYDDDIPF